MPASMRRFFQRVREAYPFTIPGTVLLTLSLYLLGIAFGTGSPYAFSFSVLSLALLFMLAFGLKIQSFRFYDIAPVRDQGQIIAATDSVYSVHFGEARPHYFFRFHCRITGKLHAGRQAVLYFSSEGSSSGLDKISVAMNFPVSGQLEAKSRILLRDVFGFTRAFIGESEDLRIPVRPPFFSEKPVIHFDPSTSLESSRKEKTASEERYYMREYIPGDRMKDINWKASFRVQELISRIAPLSPETSRLIQVDFRHFSFLEKDGPIAILHLNYLKSWLLSFITVIRRDNPDFRFNISCSGGNFLIEKEDDVERFSAFLSVLPYVHFSGESLETDPSIREHFVFTTPFDTGLNRFMASHPGVRFHLFRTSVANTGEKGKELKLFEDLSVYPGAWVMRKEKISQPPSMPGTEEKLIVKVF